MFKSSFIYFILLLFLLLFYTILSPAQNLEKPIILMLRAKWQFLQFCPRQFAEIKIILLNL